MLLLDDDLRSSYDTFTEHVINLQVLAGAPSPQLAAVFLSHTPLPHSIVLNQVYVLWGLAATLHLGSDTSHDDGM